MHELYSKHIGVRVGDVPDPSMRGNSDFAPFKHFQKLYLKP